MSHPQAYVNMKHAREQRIRTRAREDDVASGRVNKTGCRIAGVPDGVRSDLAMTRPPLSTARSPWPHPGETASDLTHRRRHLAVRTEREG